jgi:hypothetical protein
MRISVFHWALAYLFLITLALFIFVDGKAHGAEFLYCNIAGENFGKVVAIKPDGFKWEKYRMECLPDYKIVKCSEISMEKVKSLELDSMENIFDEKLMSELVKNTLNTTGKQGLTPEGMSQCFKVKGELIKLDKIQAVAIEE